MGDPDVGTTGVPPLPQSDAGASCGRGFVVSETEDYVSSNVALVGLDGTVLSESFASSATSDVGAAQRFGGEVRPPTDPLTGDRVVLLDRWPESIVHWVDLESAEVVRRLSVKTGFSSNPSDYVAVEPDKGYVSRYGHNRDAGTEPFDAGSDVLIVDPVAPAITGSIDLVPAMEGAPGFLPRPVRMVRSGEFVYAVLQSLGESFDVTFSRIARLDARADRLDGVLVLDGLENCEGVALSPGKDAIAVACSGGFDDGVPNVDRAGLAVIALPELTLRRRFAAAELTGRAPQLAQPDYFGDSRLLFTTIGDDAQGDQIVELDLASGEASVVFTSEHRAFTLGDTRCAADCGVCFVADAGPPGGRLHRLTVREDGQLAAASSIVVERRFGLPPRYLGRF